MAATTPAQKRAYYRRHPDRKARDMRRWQQRRKRHLAAYMRLYRLAKQWKAEAVAARDIIESRHRLRLIGVRQ